MAVLWALLIWFGPPMIFWLAVLLVAVIGSFEYCRMTIQRLNGAGRPVLLLVTVLPVVLSVFHRPGLVAAGLLFSLIGMIFMALWYYRQFDTVFDFLSRSMFGVIYIGFCTAHLVLIRHLPQGVSWLLLLTIITAGCDTGAYYIGKTFGHRKLCPHISPGKTVAGAIGGTSAGISSAMIAGPFLLPQINLPLIFITAMVLIFMSIIGDLTESMIKRSVGIKDSGTVLGAHGGVLDRVDSLLLSAPVLYYFLSMDILA